MTELVVAWNDTGRKCHITLTDDNLEPGFKKIGTFDLEPGDALSQDGDHVFIYEAKQILSENGIGDHGSITFEDKASNEAFLGLDHIPSTKEVADQINENRPDPVVGNDLEGDEPKKKTAKAPAKKANAKQTKK